MSRPGLPRLTGAAAVPILARDMMVTFSSPGSFTRRRAGLRPRLPLHPVQPPVAAKACFAA